MRQPFWMLVIVTAAVVASTGIAFAGTTNTIPYSCNFENFTNGTPLLDGTNGWYGDSTNIIVQTNTVRTGTNAAMIPVDCTLSNLFENMAITNVWIEMDLRPVLYDGTNHPAVDTNKTVLLYINSNGYFVVHNGPTTNASDSTNWVVTTKGNVETNGTNWVTIQIRMNYEYHTWDLYNITITNNKILVTNNIGFINPNQTNFTSFSVFNGLSTSYLDNVSVTNPPATNYFLDVTPAIVTNAVMRDYTTNITLTVTNKGASNMYWSASTTDTWVQIVGATTGTVTGWGATNLVVMNSAVTLAAGTYTGSLVVTATSADEYLSPESSVVTFVLQVMELLIAPSTTNAVVIQGEWTSNSFTVWNAGAGVLDYTVVTNQPWLVLSQTVGSSTGQTVNATNTIWITYTNTAGLTVGANYGTITISALKGGSVTLDVTLNVQAPPMLNVSPALMTNSVMAGQNLAAQTLWVWNGSSDYGIGYRVTTNQGNASVVWLSVQVTNNYLNLLTTNALTVQYAVSTLQSAGDMPSNYTGEITVTATNLANGSPAIIPVKVQVNPKPRLALSFTNLSQTVLQGRDAGSQWFEIWNSNGFYTLNYTISKGVTPWLVLAPVSGTSTGQHQRIEVQYSTANLPAGTTNAVITVVGRAWDGVNEDSARDATQQIAVALSVTPFATLTTDARSGYTYSVRKGTSTGDTVNVWNEGNPPNAMYFTVSPSVTWLKVIPSSGTSTGGNKVPVSVQADVASMKSGVYRGTVQIDATDVNSGKTAYGSPKTFTIDVVIRAFQGFDFLGSDSGASDLVVYREASGNWAIINLLSAYATNLVFGGTGYQAMPGDYSGDGVTDLGVYRPVSGSWYAWQVGAESVQVVEWQEWIGTGYVGMPGDYDGDGKVDPGVYAEQSGLWMLLLSGSGYQPISGIFGGPGYAALHAGDYDGDGKVDPGVYHRVSGLWMLLLSGTSYELVSGTFGGSGFVSVPTDYDGDGITDPAVYATESGYWYILPSTTFTSQGYSLWTRQFGGVAVSATLVPAPGDYDGVEGADLGLYDTTTGKWYISTAGGVLVVWGYPLGGFGYLPVLP